MKSLDTRISEKEGNKLIARYFLEYLEEREITFASLSGNQDLARQLNFTSTHTTRAFITKVANPGIKAHDTFRSLQKEISPKEKRKYIERLASLYKFVGIPADHKLIEITSAAHPDFYYMARRKK